VRDAVYRESNAKEPKPIRIDVVEKPRTNSMNEPVLLAGR
jgi:hypothetical protein